MEFVINDGAVGRVYVLHAGHEDGFVAHFVNGVLALFEASETDLPGFSVRFVRIIDEVFEVVSKEGRERRNSGGKKFERVFLFRGHA